MAVKRGRNISGKIRLFERMVATSWKGMQVIRDYAPKIDQVKSSTRAAVNTLLAFLASRYQTTVTEAQKQAWALFADFLNTQSSEESNRVGGGSFNVIRSRGRLMSGYNAYVYTNLALFTRGLAVPRDDAPIGGPAPTPASGLVPAVAPGTATLTWTDPDVTLYAPWPAAEIACTVWARVQRKGMVHPQLVGSFPVPTPGTITITTLRSGNTVNNPTIGLANLVGGRIDFQMDTVATIGPSFGGIISPPSEVVSAVLV